MQDLDELKDVSALHFEWTTPPVLERWGHSPLKVDLTPEPRNAGRRAPSAEGKVHSKWEALQWAETRVGRALQWKRRARNP